MGLRGNNTCLNYNRLQGSQNADVNITKSDTVNKNPVLHDQHVFTKVKLSTDEPCTNVTHDLTEEAEVVHINRKSADECALMLLIGNRDHKALWDADADRYVMSYDCYQSIPQKCKTELFDSRRRIKAANGTYIKNNREWDITFVIGDERFVVPFPCSDQLSQQVILGHKFAKALHIGTWWDQPNDIEYLMLNGKPVEQIIPSSTIKALVFCTESTIIPPYSNGYIPCKVSKEKLRASVGKNCLFDPSFKHGANYVNCTTYEGIVTLDASVVNSGTFKIVMTNRSNRHVKITKHQAMGMLKNCEEDQICAIHRIVTFEQTSKKGKEVKFELKPVEKQLYHIPSRNKKQAWLRSALSWKKTTYHLSLELMK